MKSNKHIENNEYSRQHEDIHKQREHHRRHGAKTFRRGRAIKFLERLNLRRATLKRQLETPELQSIHPILVGELKAIESVIDEFVQLFELYEFDVTNEGDSDEH